MSNLKLQFTFFPFLYLPMRTIFWYICPHNILKKKAGCSSSGPSKTNLLRTNFSYEDPGDWFYIWTFCLEPASQVSNHVIDSRCDSPSEDLLSTPLKALDLAKVYNVICPVPRQEQFTKSSNRIVSFHSHREKKTNVALRLANFL